eukprot:TRINITY_DN63864_c0_g1_i1.p1 TRINITY_DN63864_c0_g1~~TRINITY_DN63864_c0_g1_i1.p1  ORF type:complete len:239 (-),score=37.38 TRINITY_DN63864_c0_g1_i1:186-902(-)
MELWTSNSQQDFHNLGYSHRTQLPIYASLQEDQKIRPNDRAYDSNVDRLGSLFAEDPDRPRLRQKTPFVWKAAPDYEKEFRISGESNEIVSKVDHFHERDWVAPIGSSLRLVKGGVYRWTLLIEKKCPYRPQMHFGVHGTSHRRPWRLMTTTRCSRARDEEPWQDRPGGDRSIEEGDFVHIQVDLRGLHLPFGTLSVAINSEPDEVVFDDIPLSANVPMMPVVCMGGDQSRVRLCPAY